MYKVEMTDTQTKETKTIVMEGQWNGDFIWTEGNYACDCNRHNFFYPKSDVDWPCGQDRFTISFIEDEKGNHHQID